MEFLRFLIKEDIEIEARAVQGQPLWIASKLGRATMAKTLLAAGVYPDTTDYFGRTPLIIGAYGGKLDVVNALLRATNNIDQQDIHGATALGSATMRCEDKIMRLLLRAGADILPRDP